MSSSQRPQNVSGNDEIDEKTKRFRAKPGVSSSHSPQQKSVRSSNQLYKALLLS